MGDSLDVEAPAMPSIAQATEAAQKAANGCDEACRGAAAATSAALEAATRCVAARDNAAAAALVAQKRAADPDVARRRHTASREAADAHQTARRTAANAALEAREASVECAAACRLAVAAAAAAREAAARCHDATAMAAARRAADLCVVARHKAAAADAAGEAAAAARDVASQENALSRADAAAAASLAAREAADRCDTARAAKEGDGDKKFLDDMRGWLMTVATIFVNMTFDAVINPPGWIPLEFGFVGIWDVKRKHTTQVVMARIYFIMNAFTFAVGLTVIVMLLTMRKAPPASIIKDIKRLMVVLAVTVAASFAFGTSRHLHVNVVIFGLLTLYAWVVYIRTKFYNPDKMFGKLC